MQGHERGAVATVDGVSGFPPVAAPLVTERLVLRPWAERDVEDYRRLVTERGTGEPTADDIRGRITRQRESTVQTGLALLAVCRREQGDLLGYCGLIVGRATAEEPEIAFELYRRVHGRGYATEAAAAVVEAAAATGRRRLWATVGAGNAASLRVLDKLDFERHRVVDDGELVWLTRPLP